MKLETDPQKQKILQKRLGTLKTQLDTWKSELPAKVRAQFPDDPKLQDMIDFLLDDINEWLMIALRLDDIKLPK